MPTTHDMNVSLEDARFFNEKIEMIVRGPQQGHDTRTLLESAGEALYASKQDGRDRVTLSKVGEGKP